jgi:hypothetical protein
LFLTAGLVPWFYFSEALNNGTNALLEYNYLVKKVVFKISILPIIKIIAATFIHVFFVCLLLIVAAIYGYYPTIYTIQIVYYSFCLFIFVLALSYTTCAVVVFFRDLSQIISIGLQIGMWATPILWNLDSLSGNWITILKLNPLVYIVNGYRSAIYEKEWFFQDFFSIMSPWVAKRLHEFGGDITKFKVEKVNPSILDQIAIAKTEPGDDNNQDISSLVGKVDIRMLEHFAQDDADAYSYSGALCKANQGMMEFVEMFKAPIKVLHPLLTATQEGNYNGTEGLSALPFDGILLAHSNESEWQQFRNNKNNEAFLDRVYIVKVPYCLRVSEEVKIYEKLLFNSELTEAKCAPGTLELLGQFSVLSRLKEPENSSLYSKMRVYDGESLKDTDPKAKSYQELFSVTCSRSSD